MNQHPHDDLAAYALGAIDASERGAIEAHLETCAACRADVDAFRSALATYAAAADVPSADLRGRIVARARGGGWRSWLARPVPAFIPAALVVALVVSIVAFAQTRRDAEAYATALAAVPDARVLTLDAAPGSDARGALVVPQSGAAYLILRVPAPPGGKAWEAWVLRTDAPAPAGLSSSGGVVTITLTAPLRAGEGVALTLEPAAGSQAPTSTPVLVLPHT